MQIQLVNILKIKALASKANFSGNIKDILSETKDAGCTPVSLRLHFPLHFLLCFLYLNLNTGTLKSIENVRCIVHDSINLEDIVEVVLCICREI